MSWTLKNVPDYDPSLHGGGHSGGGGNSGGGGGITEIPPEILRHIKDKSIHLNQNQKIKINNSIDTKDITFQLSSPIELGEQKETEFYFPYLGKIKEVVLSINREAKMTSNIIIGIDIWNNNKWNALIPNVMLNVGEKEIRVPMERDIIIARSAIRINIKDGQFDNIKLLNIILKIKEISDPN